MSRFLELVWWLRKSRGRQIDAKMGPWAYKYSEESEPEKTKFWPLPFIFDGFLDKERHNIQNPEQIIWGCWEIKGKYYTLQNFKPKKTKSYPVHFGEKKFSTSFSLHLSPVSPADQYMKNIQQKKKIHTNQPLPKPEPSPNPLLTQCKSRPIRWEPVPSTYSISNNSKI